ncbi:MAG: hypothetical protein LBR16_05150 [Treponema sp.]|jgi:hypothetical protein|nr:hypothetical protein [Treponema sp.]
MKTKAAFPVCAALAAALFAALCAALCASCPLVYSEWDSHEVRIYNASEVDIYVQYAAPYESAPPSYWFSGAVIPSKSTGEGLYYEPPTGGYIPPTDGTNVLDLHKVLFVNNAEKKLLRRMTGSELYGCLEESVVVEKSLNQKVTHHYYDLILTDAFFEPANGE